MRSSQKSRRRMGRKQERVLGKKKKKNGLLGSAPDCERSGYLRMKEALNLAFRSLFYALFAGWWGSKLRTKDEE